jgi:TRAP-type uncharacterized transport system fused permease subunit
MRTGLAGVRFGWSAYIVPFLFVMSPSLLMKGAWFDIVLACVTATLGIYLVTVGVVGYMFRPVGPLLRLAFVVSGILLMIPANSFPGALWTDIVGFVIGVALLASEFSIRRKARLLTRPPEAPA